MPVIRGNHFLKLTTQVTPMSILTRNKATPEFFIIDLRRSSLITLRKDSKRLGAKKEGRVRARPERAADWRATHGGRGLPLFIVRKKH